MKEVDRRHVRAQTLRKFGATAEVESLLEYNDNLFAYDHLKFPLVVPQPSESFANSWRVYAVACEQQSTFDVLKNVIIQLNFPIREGISESEAYRAATRRGVVPDSSVVSPLELCDAGEIQFALYPTPAGEIPILTVKNRDDFEALIRAIVMRNEPKGVPESQGASMVANYNNWDRVRQYRTHWASTNEDTESAWRREFSQLIPQRHLYQDRFIILSEGPYSGVSADALGLSDEQWARKSLIIRREHECTHYFTKRIFQSMRNNLLDEIIADYIGIVVANGSFRGDWLLCFMGLENYPEYRDGARLQNYCTGEEGASTSKILHRLVKAVAENLAHFDASRNVEWSLREQTLRLLTLCWFTLEELASDSAVEQLINKIESWEAQVVQAT